MEGDLWEVSCPAVCDQTLRVARGFGDFYLKQNRELPQNRQAVTCEPEIRFLELNKK